MGTAEDTRRHLITEPHDGHPDTETCPGCPHKPAEDTHTDVTEQAARALCGGRVEHLSKWPLAGTREFCGECYAQAQTLAAAGLLATAPTTTGKTEADQ